MKAVEFLNKSKEIMEQRGKEYDKPDGERSMGKTVQVFNIITGHSLTEADGWLLMQILKDVRQYQTPNYHEDSAVDGVSYSALKAEALSEAAWKVEPMRTQPAAIAYGTALLTCRICKCHFTTQENLDKHLVGAHMEQDNGQ